MTELDNIQSIRETFAQLGSDTDFQALHNMTMRVFSDVVDRLKENYGETIAKAMKGDGASGLKGEKMATVLALLLLLLKGLETVMTEKTSELVGAMSK